MYNLNENHMLLDFVLGKSRWAGVISIFFMMFEVGFTGNILDNIEIYELKMYFESSTVLQQ